MSERGNLYFKGLTLKAGRKGKRTCILENVSGTLTKGDVCAVMGPSGSGKTTLLNVLCLKANYGELTGEIKLDKRHMDDKIFKEKCFLVEQYDSNWPYLKVRETCFFAAKLFGNSKSSSAIEIEDRLDDVLNEVGLSTAKDTMNKNLSGGQQRRLSLAIALMKQPEVLFLDEVTSGLDSASAESVCGTLRKIADEENITIVCTIHQPSTTIFLECFNKLILLSMGKVAYIGGTVSAQGYFSSLGYPLPSMTNPSEHYLRLLNSDFGSVDKVKDILQIWERRRPLTEVKGEMVEEESGDDFVYSDAFKSRLDEAKWLFKRHFLMISRDPILYIGRCIAVLILNGVFATVYWKARDYVQDQVMSKAWLIVWFVGIPAIMGAGAVFVLNDELSKICNEQRNGVIHPGAYLTAKIILTLGYILIYGLSALMIPAYVMQKYPIEKFAESFLFWSIIAYLYETVAELLAALVNNPIIGVMFYLSLWIISFLFSGLFLPVEDLLWPLKLFYYTTPLSFYIRGNFYLNYSDAKFEPCLPAENPNEPICIADGDSSKILDTLHRILPQFENRNTVTRDMMIPFAMIITLKIIYIVVVMMKGSRASMPVSGKNDKSCLRMNLNAVEEDIALKEEKLDNFEENEILSTKGGGTGRGAITIYDLGTVAMQSAPNEEVEENNVLKSKDLDAFEDNKGDSVQGVTIYDLGTVTKQSVQKEDVEEDNVQKVKHLDAFEDNKGSTNSGAAFDDFVQIS